MPEKPRPEQQPNPTDDANGMLYKWGNRSLTPGFSGFLAFNAYQVGINVAEGKKVEAAGWALAAFGSGLAVALKDIANRWK